MRIVVVPCLCEASLLVRIERSLEVRSLIRRGTIERVSKVPQRCGECEASLLVRSVERSLEVQSSIRRGTIDRTSLEGSAEVRRRGAGFGF